MQLELNRYYVTKAGYIIKLHKQDKRGVLFKAPPKMSPGVNSYNNKTIEGWSWNIDGSITGLKQEWADKLKIVGELPVPMAELPEGYQWAGGYPQYRSAKKGEHFISSMGGVISNNDRDYPDKPINHRFIIEPKEALKLVVGVSPTVSQKPDEKEVEMKKETAIAVAKFSGNLAWRATNYWLFEPATNIARPIVRTFRYAVFLSVLSGGLYAAKNPEPVKDFVLSCLPKVTIESPTILK